VLYDLSKGRIKKAAVKTGVNIMMSKDRSAAEEKLITVKLSSKYICVTSMINSVHYTEQL